MTLIDSGTFGSNDGPFLHALVITIDLEGNVKSLSNFKHLSTSSDNSIKPNFHQLKNEFLYLNLTQSEMVGLLIKVKMVTIYQSLNIHLFYYLLLQT